MSLSQADGLQEGLGQVGLSKLSWPSLFSPNLSALPQGIEASASELRRREPMRAKGEGGEPACTLEGGDRAC